MAATGNTFRAWSKLVLRISYATSSGLPIGKPTVLSQSAERRIYCRRPFTHAGSGRAFERNEDHCGTALGPFVSHLESQWTMKSTMETT